MPRFAGLFETLDMPLPPTTKALMAISDVLTGYWWMVVPALGAAVGGLVWWLRTPPGRRVWHAFLVWAPQIGRVTRSFATARIARLLGVLLQSRVPLLEALELTRESCTNTLYADLLVRTQEAVTRGEPISASLTEGGLIAESVAEAIRNGERSGRVAEVL